jgi:hypothetical protein
MQRAVCAAAMTPGGRAFLAGARGAREVVLDPCGAQPITLIAEARIALAPALGSTGDNAGALAAAATGLELVPRDADLLRSQAVALAGLGRSEAGAALAAYDRFRSPDSAAELRIRCAAASPRCAREREQGHTHALHPIGGAGCP